jgi:hypothetical protein
MSVGVDVDVDAADIAYVPAVGEERSLPSRRVAPADLYEAAPWRTFRWYYGQRHLPDTCRYHKQLLGIVDRFEGHLGSTKGDGLLAVFGHPRAHEDDVRRAVVAAGLEITREVSRLSEQAKRRFGIEIAVRAGVHRGVAYLAARRSLRGQTSGIPAYSGNRSKNDRGSDVRCHRGASVVEGEHLRIRYRGCGIRIRRARTCPLRLFGRAREADRVHRKAVVAVRIEHYSVAE